MKVWQKNLILIGLVIVAGIIALQLLQNKRERSEV